MSSDNLLPKFNHVKCLITGRMTPGLAPEKAPPLLPVLPLDEALRRRWAFDAHLGLYAPSDRHIQEAYRLRKSHLDIWTEECSAPVWQTVMVDLDAHDLEGEKEVAAWWEQQLVIIQRVGLPHPDWYRTRGGARLVWRLTEPITEMRQYERIVAGVISECARGGLKPDMACDDATRLFRAPLVNRDGELIEYPSCFNGAELEPREYPLIEGTQLARRFRRGAGSASTTLGQEKQRPSGETFVTFKGLPALLDSIDCEQDEGRDKKTLWCRCPWEHEHSSKTYELNSSTALLRRSKGWGFVCLHRHSGAAPHRQGRRYTAHLKESFPEHWDFYVSPVVDTSRASRRPDSLPQEPAKIDLPQLRRTLLDEILRLAESVGAYHLCSPLGSGKTYAACAAIAELGRRWGDLDITAHIVLACTTRAVRDEVFREVQHACNRAGVFLPIERQTGREPQYCREHVNVQAVRQAAGPVAAKRFCNHCDFYGCCEAVRRMKAAGARRGKKGVRVTVATHEALLCWDSEQIDPPDIIIVDEAPSVHRWVEVTPQHITHGVGRGFLEFKELEGLVKLLGESGTQGGKSIDGPALYSQLNKIDVDATRVLRESANILYKLRQWEVSDHTVTMPAAAAWRSLETKPPGAYIYKGNLHLPDPDIREFRAPTIIYLDGTPSNASRRRLSDEQITHGKELDAAIDLTVIHVDAPGGRRGQLRNPKVSYVVRKYHDSELTYHVTHKGLVDSPELLGEHDWITDARGPVDWHKGPTARGSNAYAGCTKIVIDDYHEPRVSVRALAERLGDYQSAAYESRIAQLLQEVGRIRPHLGGRTVVFIGRKPPTAVLAAADHYHRVDWRTYHYEMTGEVLGLSGLVAWAQNTVDVFGAARISDNSELNAYSRSYDYFKGSGPRGLAKAAGLTLLTIRWLDTRAQADSDRRRVGHWLVPQGFEGAEQLIPTGSEAPQWYEVSINGHPSKRVYTDNCRLRVAARQILKAGAPLTLENVATQTGVRKRSVLRALRRMGLRLRDLLSQGGSVEVGAQRGGAEAQCFSSPQVEHGCRSVVVPPPPSRGPP